MQTCTPDYCLPTLSIKLSFNEKRRANGAGGGRSVHKGQWCPVRVYIDSRYGIKPLDMCDQSVAAGLSGLFLSDWWISIVSTSALPTETLNVCSKFCEVKGAKRFLALMRNIVLCSWLLWQNHVILIHTYFPTNGAFLVVFHTDINV